VRRDVAVLVAAANPANLGGLEHTFAGRGKASAPLAFGFYMTFEGYARPAIKSGLLVTLLDDRSPMFPGPFLYYPGRRH
jgi:hypothetical protein